MPATYASISALVSGAVAAPRRVVRRGRSRPSAGNGPEARSSRRRSPTACRSRPAAGTPSATADPGRGRNPGRRGHRVWLPRRCAGWRRHRARSRPVASARRPRWCRSSPAAIAARTGRPRPASRAARATRRTSAFSTARRMSESYYCPSHTVGVSRFEAGPRSPLHGIQLSRLGGRPDSHRQAVPPGRRPRSGRVLRGVAGVRTCRQRAAVDRTSAGHHRRPSRRPTSAASIRAGRRKPSPISSTAGRAVRTSSRCCGSSGRCSIDRDRSKDSSWRDSTRRRPTSPLRSTASRPGRWRSM